MKSTFILVAFVILTGSMAVAQTSLVETNTRQHVERARIAQGKHAGTITRKEAHLFTNNKKTSGELNAEPKRMVL